MARSDYTHKMVGNVKVDLTEAEIDELVKRDEAWAAGAAARAWVKLRRERNVKLAQSDYMALYDSPSISTAWKTYRQELRDLPSKYDDTTVQGTITWPTEPS